LCDFEDFELSNSNKIEHHDGATVEDVIHPAFSGVLAEGLESMDSVGERGLHQVEIDEGDTHSSQIEQEVLLEGQGIGIGLVEAGVELWTGVEQRHSVVGVEQSVPQDRPKREYNVVQLVHDRVQEVDGAVSGPSPIAASPPWSTIFGACTARSSCRSCSRCSSD
jgi:hypothetical protein